MTIDEPVLESLDTSGSAEELASFCLKQRYCRYWAEHQIIPFGWNRLPAMRTTEQSWIDIINFLKSNHLTISWIKY